MFKPFYVHGFHVGPVYEKYSRGFTVKISPDPDNQRNVLVQLTLCAPVDEFVKKEGRSQADAAPAQSINKRNIPRVLAELSATAALEDQMEESYWYYVLKYVV